MFDGKTDSCNLFLKIDFYEIKYYNTRFTKILESLPSIELHDDPPHKVATDGLASYPRAISEDLGEDVEHEVRPCTENPIEQSHRPVKHRYHSTLGFGEFNAAHRFCKAVDEVSNFLRPRSRLAAFVSLSEKRKKFIKGVSELKEIFQAT